jgi:UDP-2,3-diacylglucosamine hydrolase
VTAAAARFDAVFASDVHLSAAHPATTEAFFAFVDAAVAGRTGRFVLLGDLFEYWLGDDDADDALAFDVAARLRSLADRGVRLSFMPGNRDFLVGPAFANAAGLEILGDPHAETIGGLSLLLSHGDSLCTDDVDYQRFRAMVRQPAWQAAFLARPMAERRTMVQGARRESEAAKQVKSAGIMDVNGAAVTSLLDAHPGTVLVHGHTHRPARHAHVVADAARERWVLTDWDADAAEPRGGGLAIVDGRVVVLGMDGRIVNG